MDKSNISAEVPYSTSPERVIPDENISQSIASEFYYQKALKYENHINAESNWERAVLWYRKAAELGHPEAQYQLHKCYLSGCGIALNPTQARYWYREAVKSGSIQAKKEYMIGNTFMDVGLRWALIGGLIGTIIGVVMGKYIGNNIGSSFLGYMLGGGIGFVIGGCEGILIVNILEDIGSDVNSSFKRMDVKRRMGGSFSRIVITVSIMAFIISTIAGGVMGSGGIMGSMMDVGTGNLAENIKTGMSICSMAGGFCGIVLGILVAIIGEITWCYHRKTM